MCQSSLGGPSDRAILDFLAENDFEGDLNPSIARSIADDYRTSKATGKLVATFKGEDGKVIPLNVHLRKLLADFISPLPDSS